MPSDNEVIPVFEPGAFLKEEMDFRGWSLPDFARRAGLTGECVESVLDGTQVIDMEVARKIGKAFGTSGTIWVNLQAAHSQFLLDLDDAQTKAVEDTVEAKDAEIARLRAALEWYEERVRVFWAGRVEERPFAAGQELQADSGARARRALDGKEADGADQV